MNVSIIIISVLISVICVLVALLQYYYINYKKATSVKLYEPVFDDLITTDEASNCPIRNPDEWNPDDTKVLTVLQAALESQQFIYKPKPTLTHRNDNYKSTEKEIHNSLQAALTFKLLGKQKKALKLFEHAASIGPNNPEVLTHYGEFMEHLQNDVVSADQLYFKALSVSPHHKGALINLKRTSHLVDQLDLQMFDIIDEKQEVLKRISSKHPSFEVVKKQAYYLHIYHTVGIEGNTLTLEQLRFLLETGRAVAGKSIIEHNEILGLQLAMKYVKILTRMGSINVKEILGVHRRVMGHVDPLNSGVFRKEQVFVGSHVPPPPDELPTLMNEYVDWLNSEEAQTMHPVRYAALAHYKLVDIHPFSDGNGRTSRLIMNLILLRAGYPPVIIMKEHRKEYYEYLKLANEGDVRPFVRFIAHCTEQILNLYLWSAEKFAQLEEIHSIGTVQLDKEFLNL